MERLYFTFGSDPQFPFGMDDYIVVLGTDKRDCIGTFKKKHPNRPGSDCINCADYYTPAEWAEHTKKYYKGVEPKEIIISETTYGIKPKDFDPIWFAIPSKNEIIFLQPGSGDNLTREDREDGYVDYLDFTSFTLDHAEVNECDGGMLLLEEYVSDKYTCLADTIPDILDIAYDDPYLDAQIINRSV